MSGLGMTNRRLSPLTARILAVILALAWLAARPVGALSGDDQKPIEIEADNVELDETQSTSVYVGNVQVDQGSMRILADHVTVYHHEDRRIKFIIALGQPVRYKQQLDDQQGEMRARAARMDYDADKDELILTGDAVVTQGEDRLASERIIYDRARERMRAGGSGRVRITITPEEASAGEGRQGGQRNGAQPGQQAQPQGAR